MKKTVVFNIIFAVTIIVLIGVCCWKNCHIAQLVEESGVADANSVLQAEQKKKEDENRQLSSRVSDLTAEVAKKEAEIIVIEKQIAELDGAANNTGLGSGEKEALLRQKAALEQQKTLLEAENRELAAEIAELERVLEINNNTFLVVYVDDGGIVYKEKVLKNGSVINVPTLAERTGYNAEWSRNGENITEDTAILARYTAKTYNINYILGRPLDNGSTRCGAVQYDENNEVVLDGNVYVLDFVTNIVYQKDDPSINSPITNNQFTISSVSYTINQKYKIVYAVVGQNDVIARPAFYSLPTTVKYDEIVRLPYQSTDYIYPVKPDGTVGTGDADGSRSAETWVIFGADSLSYDANYTEGITTIFIQASDDILVFVYYAYAAM